jgi:hypothetical protein
VSFEVLKRWVLPRVWVRNPRIQSEKWNSGVKEHLAAISQVTSRRADVRAFREFVKVRVSQYEALWKEYTKPRWARLRISFFCGKQRAFANFSNELNALKEDESQRLVLHTGQSAGCRKKGLRQLRRHERTRRAHGVSSRYLQMSSERPTCTTS